MEKKHHSAVTLKLTLYSIVLGGIFAALIYFLITESHHMRASHTDTTSTLWKYQCIDTMKTSRDRARNWQYSNDLHSSIQDQVSIIKELGANCIAIDTPYDPEFRSYLTDWVREARKQNLHIWFRGNFSGWEGWFDYPHTLTSTELLTKTTSFIEENPELFSDGDIFTPAPEAENGGEFNQVEIDEYPAFRTFLHDEYTTAKNSFQKIGKNVEVNWLSMNGGLAKRMLDQQTITDIGNVVAIDHYIKTAPEMSEFINYFYQTFGAKVVIGEFGSPIPDINGYMTEDEQASFTEELYRELYTNRDKIEGINYWVLYDSSTALLNADGSKRKAADIVEKYYKPLIIKGVVQDIIKSPIPNVIIREKTYSQVTQTDEAGEFRLLIPRDKTEITLSADGYISKTLTINESTSIPLSITLIKENPTILDKLRDTLKK